jgi:hypothetical protein
VIVIPSRWESGPIVAWEMLALGGTVVGTPIPNVCAFAAADFGRVSATHSAGGLAAALNQELDAWEHGQRDPRAIAAHWRAYVSPKAVAERMLALMRLSPVCTQTT